MDAAFVTVGAIACFSLLANVAFAFRVLHQNGALVDRLVAIQSPGTLDEVKAASETRTFRVQSPPRQTHPMDTESPGNGWGPASPDDLERLHRGERNIT